MVDIVNSETRSRMMSGIRGKNTKPEIVIRSLLHRRGFRFRLHDKKLPGKPDIVLPRYRAVIMINGCFWHGHDCHLFKWPSSNVIFWKEKIIKNQLVDEITICSLEACGWRVLTIWECALKGKTKRRLDDMLSEIVAWLTLGKQSAVIRGV